VGLKEGGERKEGLSPCGQAKQQRTRAPWLLNSNDHRKRKSVENREGGRTLHQYKEKLFGTTRRRKKGQECPTQWTNEEAAAGKGKEDLGRIGHARHVLEENMNLNSIMYLRVSKRHPRGPGNAVSLLPIRNILIAASGRWSEGARPGENRDVHKKRKHGVKSSHLSQENPHQNGEALKTSVGKPSAGAKRKKRLSKKKTRMAEKKRNFTGKGRKPR